MTTKLTRRVERLTEERWGGGRPLVVALEPRTENECAMVSIREKGRRTKFSLPVSTIYKLAALDEIDRRALQTSEAKKPNKPRQVERGILSMRRK